VDEQVIGVALEHVDGKEISPTCHAITPLAWIPMQGSSVNKICSQCLIFSCLFRMF
jgi:hypothetical protein